MRPPCRRRYDVAARSVVILERRDGMADERRDRRAGGPRQPAAVRRHDGGRRRARRLCRRLRHPGEHRPAAVPRGDLDREPDVAASPTRRRHLAVHVVRARADGCRRPVRRRDRRRGRQVRAVRLDRGPGRRPGARRRSGVVRRTDHRALRPRRPRRPSPRAGRRRSRRRRPTRVTLDDADDIEPGHPA